MECSCRHHRHVRCEQRLLPRYYRPARLPPERIRTHSMKIMRLRNLLSCILLVAASACVHVQVQRSSTSPDAAIRATLDSTAAGWNRGDLATYLAAYTPDASEMLSDGVAHGVDKIEQTMKQGFWKSGRPLQQLHYEHVEVRMLGEDHALVTGQFLLEGAGRPQRTGWFTTVWARTSDGWRMIHDHS